MRTLWRKTAATSNVKKNAHRLLQIRWRRHRQKIAVLQEQISAFDGDKAVIETLTAENGALKETIAKRDAEEAQKQQMDALRSQFDDASQGRKFLNSYTEAAIFEQFKAAMNEGERKQKQSLKQLQAAWRGFSNPRIRRRKFRA